MNRKLSGVYKNISYTVISNLVALTITVLVTFIVPKAISVEDYGLFQLYLFYASYVGIFHLGWMDGLFLRYGGAYYDDLNKSLLKGELILFIIFETIISILLCIGAFIFNADYNNKFVFCVTAASVVLINVRVFFLDILQCTGRIKEYSILNVIGRILYICFVIILVQLGYRKFYLYVIADICGRIVSTIYGGIKCRDILFANKCEFPDALKESKENIKTGIKLLLATIASSLIIGVVRLGINSAWDITTFAKVSLTLSISNFLIVFVRAVALVLFPTLRRVDENKLDQVYDIIRSALMFPLLGVLVLYYPIRIIIGSWLPQYAESLKYMALLFPMCIYESKMSMLIGTYMKVLRKEQQLMTINIVTLILSVFITGINCFVIRNLDVAVTSIVLLLAFRCVWAEVLLMKNNMARVRSNILFELALTVVFISSSWFVGGIKGTVVYFIAYLFYIFQKKNDFTRLLHFLKKQQARI